MLLAVISDTHLPRGRRRLPDDCVARLEQADLILHAGDVLSASTLAELELIGPPVVAVQGNQDDDELRRRLPVERTVEADGRADRHGARRRAQGRPPAPPPAALPRRRTRWCSATRTSRCTSRTTASRSSTRAAPPTAAARPRYTMGLAHVSGDRVRFELVEVG